MEALVLQLQLARPQPFLRRQRLALVGAFARQHAQRLQPPGEHLVTQQHFGVGHRAVPAAGGKHRPQAGRDIKARAVHQIQRGEVR